MDNTLVNILRTFQPMRGTLMDLLSPSELMDLCIATRIHLTKHERSKYMNPLREVFYSLVWTDKLISEFSDVALLGRDVRKLSDSRCTELHVWFLTYRTRECTDYASIPDLENHSPELLEKLRSMCTIQYVRPEVNVIPLTTTEHDSVPHNKRLNLYSCVMDTERTFGLSLNSILYIAERPSTEEDRDELHNFRYVRRNPYLLATVQIPYILYRQYLDINDKVCKFTGVGTEELLMEKYNDRRCLSCRDVIYTSVRMNKDYWPAYSTVGGLDITWRIWYLHVVCRSNSTTRHRDYVNRVSLDHF